MHCALLGLLYTILVKLKSLYLHIKDLLTLYKIVLIWAYVDEVLVIQMCACGRRHDLWYCMPLTSPLTVFLFHYLTLYMYILCLLSYYVSIRAFWKIAWRLHFLKMKKYTFPLAFSVYTCYLNVYNSFTIMINGFTHTFAFLLIGINIRNLLLQHITSSTF